MFCSHGKVEGILLWGFHSKRHFKGQDAVLVGPDNKVGFIQELFCESDIVGSARK